MAAALTGPGTAESESDASRKRRINRLYPTPSSDTRPPNTTNTGSAENAGSGTSRILKSGSSPRTTRLHITAVETAAMVHSTYRSLIECAISSRQNTAPPSGALKATARPAPDRADCMTRTSSRVARATRAHHAPMAAPMWTVGPSRPSTRPPSPIERSPPMNRAGRTRPGGGSLSPRSTASTCWMPLPADRGIRDAILSLIHISEPTRPY